MAEDVLTTVMAFIYTIGHWIGDKIVGIIQSAAGIIIPPSIVDAVGMLVILSIFLSIAEVARKAIWIVVSIGWVLIVLRIAILMIG
ncbi:MAG: hypothetical protein OIN89_04115 [Candidatus Methanoperedens sp.]|jgi:hypothetical protein|nr:hypothetical protein [Candidatus Methanoperedens sp.]PKL54036.1 MAG: hypothetical protein CVV36_04040 [Candidatus Methanoperedenaceae archaeon HGW-Methanoperedenaceae-1]